MFVFNIHRPILKYSRFLKYLAPLMGVHVEAMCKYGTLVLLLLVMVQFILQDTVKT
jgi:hypothetical protein